MIKITDVTVNIVAANLIRKLIGGEFITALSC